MKVSVVMPRQQGQIEPTAYAHQRTQHRSHAAAVCQRPAAVRRLTKQVQIPPYVPAVQTHDQILFPRKFVLVIHQIAFANRLVERCL